MFEIAPDAIYSVLDVQAREQRRFLWCQVHFAMGGILTLLEHLLTDPIGSTHIP
jgi:hypothetical protein